MTRLQRIAREEASMIRSQIGLETNEVNIAAICRQLDIEVHERLFPLELDGLSFKTPKGYEHIYINNHTKKNAGRRHWVAAHELGHIILARRILFADQEYWLDSLKAPHTPLECACNLFAAELLLPADMMRRTWAELSSNKRYRVAIIANRCGVSPVAVRVRAEHLGLIATQPHSLVKRYSCKEEGAGCSYLRW